MYCHTAPWRVCDSNGAMTTRTVLLTDEGVTCSLMLIYSPSLQFFIFHTVLYIPENGMDSLFLFFSIAISEQSTYNLFTYFRSYLICIILCCSSCGIRRLGVCYTDHGDQYHATRALIQSLETVMEVN